MRKSFTFLLLLGTVGVGFYAFAKDKSNISTSVTRGLVIDCSLLLKEYDRIKSEVYKIETALTEFKNISIQDNSAGFLNRASAWCKAALYSLNNHFKHITNSYEHCTCEAGKIAVPTELQVLLEKIQKEHFLLINRINALKTVINSFQSKMQSGLN